MRIYIKSLEPLENRYTSQWKISVPLEIKNFFEEKGKEVKIVKYEDSFIRNDNDYYNQIEIVDVEGSSSSIKQTALNGSFLNFSDTNYWKSSQLMKFVDLINKNMIYNEDKILITDAWDPTIIQLKYMASLIENLKNIKMIGLWHAGSYDKNDFLGRLIKDKKWTRNTERAIYYSLDHNIFATNYHIGIFTNIFVDETYNSGSILNEKEEFINHELKNKKMVLSGQPHDLLVKTLDTKIDINKKENIILFPHRIAPEKQLEIFKDLKREFNDYEFIVCQEKNLTKDEYHELLRRSKMVFSANLQETLGISVMEGILTNNIVVVPNRLSYKEMYDDFFKYPSDWTSNISNYEQNKRFLVEFIRNKLDNYFSEETQKMIKNQKSWLKKRYLNARLTYELLV